MRTKSSIRSKFLAPEILEKAATEVADLAYQQNLRVALVGGYALQLYGSPRLTGDIDVISFESIEGLPGGKPLSFGGVQTESKNGVPIDLIIRSDDFADLYQDALSDTEEFEGVSMPVASLEFIVAMKLEASRKKDEADLEWIILHSDLDFQKTKMVIRRYLGRLSVKEWEQFVEETKWKASREQ